MMANFSGESEEYKSITRKEFEQELTKALNNRVGNKEIVWVESILRQHCEDYDLDFNEVSDPSQPTYDNI